MLTFLLTIADEQYHQQIERLFKRYHKPMLRYAKHRFYIANRNNFEFDAEDAVQSTFEKIARYAHIVPFGRPEKELEAYVYAILQNEISKILQEPEMICEDIANYVDLGSAQDLGEKIRIRDRYDTVVALFKTIDPKYSTVLMLYYCEEMTVKEIAKMLVLSEKTVYTRLHRGKQKVIDALGKGDGE